MDTKEKLRVLAKIAAELNGAGITYAVGASLLLYLRGLADGFNDIDLSVLEEDAERAIGILQRLGTMAPPDQGPGYLTRCFREFTIDGVEVDLIAGMVIEKDGVPCDCALRREDVDGTVGVDGVEVPLHALECWERFYTLMGRQAKADLIGNALCRSGRLTEPVKKPEDRRGCAII